MNIFDTILVQPLVNVLVFFYSVIPLHDFGIAIILVTLLIRGILWPLQSQTLRSQKGLTKLQPEIKKIQEKYKNDPKKVQEMTLELYKEKEVNPFSSCLPSLIQLPLLFALYYAIMKFSAPAFIKLIDPNAGIWSYLYPWMRDLGFVKSALSVPFNTYFLGIFNLANKALASTSPLVINKEVIITLLAGATQFIQLRQVMAKQPGTQAGPTAALMYMMPLMILYIGFILPAALPLYWTVTTVMSYFQQWFVMRGDVEELDKEAVIEVEADEAKAAQKQLKGKKKKK